MSGSFLNFNHNSFKDPLFLIQDIAKSKYKTPHFPPTPFNEIFEGNGIGGYLTFYMHS